jgi:hypothetical protein
MLRITASVDFIIRIRRHLYRKILELDVVSIPIPDSFSACPNSRPLLDNSPGPSRKATSSKGYVQNLKVVQIFDLSGVKKTKFTKWFPKMRAH